jgi:hypothetical protein
MSSNKKKKRNKKPMDDEEEEYKHVPEKKDDRFKGSVLDRMRTIARPIKHRRMREKGQLVFGVTGTDEGELLRPTSVAVSYTGMIYVADNGNHRIQCFHPNGTFSDVWSVYMCSTEIKKIVIHTSECIFTNQFVLEEVRKVPYLYYFPPGLLPMCIAYIGEERLYINRYNTDEKTFHGIRCFELDGTYRSTIGKYEPGHLLDFCIDNHDTVYILSHNGNQGDAEDPLHIGLIREYDVDGKLIYEWPQPDDEPTTEWVHKDNTLDTETFAMHSLITDPISICVHATDREVYVLGHHGITRYDRYIKSSVCLKNRRRKGMGVNMINDLLCVIVDHSTLLFIDSTDTLVRSFTCDQPSSVCRAPDGTIFVVSTHYNQVYTI